MQVHRMTTEACGRFTVSTRAAHGFSATRSNSANQGGPFPGLRLISETPAMPGDYDAIEPGSMHLPVFPPEGGSVIIVVYKDDLEFVVRRGYLREIQQPVRFRGQFPSRENRVE